MEILNSQNVSEDTKSFQLLLTREFNRRRALNPRYSLRAFAKNLELDASYLSKLLRSKRPINNALKNYCCEKLGWKFSEPLENSSKRFRDSYLSLNLKSFNSISELHHQAMFELIKIKNGEWDCDSIAEELSITVPQAQTALEALRDLGLIQKKGFRYERTNRGITTTANPFSTEVLRRLQKDILRRAILAMENVPIEQRDQSGLTLAIPSSKLPEAKRLLKQFRRRFCSLMQKEGELDSVYQLSLSFYPLTKSTLKKSSV